MSVEKRQERLGKNGEDTERWMARLFRATNELRKLREQRKRLLKLPTAKQMRDLRYRAKKRERAQPHEPITL
jgi:hypothetical protein